MAGDEHRWPDADSGVARKRRTRVETTRWQGMKLRNDWPGERERVAHEIRRAHGNILAAARRIGVTGRNLYDWLAEPWAEPLRQARDEARELELAERKKVTEKR